MIVFFLAAVLEAGSAPPSPPRYQFVPGETLRYLIQRDPYFDDPKGAMEAVMSDEYRPPIVERLTEKVQEVKADGTATLRLTLAPEPGFEDAGRPQAEISRDVTVTALGRVVPAVGSVPQIGPAPQIGSAPQSSPAEQDLLRGIVLLSADWQGRKDGLAVETRRSPAAVTQSTSPNHDGTLLQTTSAAQAARFVFDCRRGQLVREACTLTITLSLVMTGRGRRGSDDFGHVIPNTKIIQTLSVERQTD